MTDKQNYFTYIDNTSDDTDKIMENLHKQTIIDGVDVSGCECYSEYREGYCGWFTPCEGDSCQYKLDWALQQLKAKEQECKKWKEYGCFYLDKFIQYKQTLAEIKDIAMGIMDNDLEESSAYYDANNILNKISEVIE